MVLDLRNECCNGGQLALRAAMLAQCGGSRLRICTLITNLPGVPQDRLSQVRTGWTRRQDATSILNDIPFYFDANGSNDA